MITRSKLVERLRDHQVRSRRRCPGLALFSPKPHIATRADAAVAIFWAVVFSILVGLTYLAFCHGHFWLSFLTAGLGSCLLVCFWKSRHALAREKEKRLPLSL
ncbi:hypothetical protein EUGRSUZ_I02454 [Eucalyptus grandis]|uniref:Uncharacterized protein n=3 Tax=Eucalyptus TaxID=3932 RepID=A0A059ASM4_EUCGR|nr:hypothetical protein EUGRSUZ_I02454 [Eucalyptus grandis]